MTSTSVLDTILWNLRSGDRAIREKALQSFEDYVRSSLASGKSDDGESFWDEVINRVLFPLTSMSDTPQEKLVGIAAIDKLLSSPSDDAHPTTAPASASSNPSAASTSSTNPSAKRFLYRLLRYLKNLLPDPSLQVMIAAAATYGRILKAGGQVFAETVLEMEVQSAVSYMEEQAGYGGSVTGGDQPNSNVVTDGLCTYGEWNGTTARARIIANQSNKVQSLDPSMSAAMTATMIPATPNLPGGLVPIDTSATSLAPRILIPNQPQSPLSPIASKMSSAPRAKKEKILAPHARIAGVLILVQIATHMPQMYYQHITLILSRIICPLRDGCRFWVVKGSLGLDGDGWDGVEEAGAIPFMPGEEEHSSDPLSTSHKHHHGGSTRHLQTIAGGKPMIDAVDIVRRLAAKLFRVTLDVIATREASLGLSASNAQSPAETEPARPSAIRGLSTSTSMSVSSSSMFSGVRGSRYLTSGGDLQPFSSGGSNQKVRTSKPLVEVATAAANDLVSYLKSVGLASGVQDSKAKNKTVSSLVQLAQATGKGTALPAGNIHRAFGALLIYRELFDSGLASLAGIFPGDEVDWLRESVEDMDDPSQFTRSRQATASMSLAPSAEAPKSRLVRGGIRYPVEDTNDWTAVEPHKTAGTSRQVSSGTTGKHASIASTKPKQVVVGIRPILLPSEALAKPAEYTEIFSSVFLLATRYSTSAAPGASSSSSGVSLLTAGTQSLARAFGAAGPTSPIARPSLPSTSASSASAFSLDAAPGMTGVDGAVVFAFSGPGWSTPLPSLSRYEQDEQIRKEALSLLPVCAAYDAIRFERGGWLSVTAAAILKSWGIASLVHKKDSTLDQRYSEGKRASMAGHDGDTVFFDPVATEKSLGLEETNLIAKIPVERGERDYLLKALAELAYAMRNSNAMARHSWAVSLILHGSLESRTSPPEPWKYGAYYSPESIIARRIPTPRAVQSVEPSHPSKGSQQSRGATAAERARHVSSGPVLERNYAEKVEMPPSGNTSDRRESQRIGSKAVIVPKGSLSEEVLFEAIALFAISMGEKAIAAFRSCGRSIDAQGYILREEEADADILDRRAVEKLFRFGITPALCDWLGPIVATLPGLLHQAQEHLLNEISTVLAGHGFVTPGSPPEGAGAGSEEGNLRPKTKSGIREETNPNSHLVRLALTILHSFDWHGKTLTPLIRDGVLKYTESKDRDVRLQASLATCSLFMSGPIASHTSTASVGIIDEVVGRLIRVALADSDHEIRSLVLSHLDHRYDRHLAQIEHIRVLSMALNDEEPQVRLQAVRIMGRLALLNPANVLPNLRMELIKLLTELEYSIEPATLLTTAEVLTELLKRTDRLLKPYVPSLLKVCLPKAQVTYPYVSRRMVQCVGLLATISGEDLTPHFDEIMQLCIGILHNPTAVLIKKEITLVTIGQVCANTANVIDPYLRYPDLFALLKGFLKDEYGERTKRKALQVMGILGAIDPFTRRKTVTIEVQEKSAAAKALQQSVKSVGSQPEVFYQSVVIQALLSILADASLATNHPDVIEVVISIFRTQGLKCVPFLPQIIPAFAAMCRASSARHQDFYLTQMSLIVQVVGSHIRNYLDEIFQLTRELWPNPLLHLPIVGLIESLASAMGAEFKTYLPSVIPQLLSAFDQPEGHERNAVEVRVFQAMLSFGSAIEQYIHLILPVMLATVERPTAARDSKRVAVVTIADLSQRINLADSLSRIVQPLVRTLPTADNPLRDAIMKTFCVLLLQLNSDFAVFIPRIQSCISENHIAATRFEKLADDLMKGEPLPQGMGSDERWSKPGNADPIASAETAKWVVNQMVLKTYWSVEHNVRPEDWQLWFKRLTLELMKQSTSPALRACVSLANSHEPLARELFNAAFYSCWVELNDQNKEHLVAAVTLALTESRSADLRLRLLSLVEFMEHEDKALPINNRTLGDIAATTFAMAKALHFKEHEYLSTPSVTVVEQLIGINASLKQQDAALGLLNNEMIGFNINPVLWYEQLDRWEDASIEYAHRIAQAPDEPTAIIGRLKCLHALNEWDALGQGVEQRWPSASPQLKASIAPFAAASAWVLRRWHQMDQYVAAMTSATTERSFFKAILSVHNNQFDTASVFIGKARDALVTELGAIDDYNRVYSTIVRTQLLSELEEVITYKKSADQPEVQQMIRKTWSKRLQGCQRDVDTWQRILQLRSLVVTPSEDANSYIKFANLCRKANRLNLAESIIQQLLTDQTKKDTPIRASPSVVFAHLKLLWDTGDKDDSLNYLGNVCTSLAREIGLDDPGRIITGNLEEVEEVRRLLSRAFLKQGQWIQSLRPEWITELVEDVIQCYQNATQLDPTWYKAWHTWALCNFEVINHLENAEEDRDEEAHSKTLLTHILAAVVGFFRSVALGGENPIQDSLRLLTLWFKFGSDEEVNAVVAENFGTVSIDTWLEVVPQLIARIQTPSHTIRAQINTLLTQVGRVHPQALIYPLTVASKSNSDIRSVAAEQIMNRLREHSGILVEQALLVSDELIRVAILWHELWHEFLEEASRLYFTEKKPEAMIEHLELLHKKLDRGPETTREASFIQVHGKDLREAREACHRYLQRHEASDMDKAWDIYYAVFRRIEKQLPLLTTIDLQYVSPKLLQAENLELAVPGTYRSGQPVTRIARFVAKLSVIASKQRPRRLAIMGSNGKEYQFCLKGHEDIRQDERVMQVFSLVNTLLSADRQSFMRRLHIHSFAAIPLAPNVGLLQWVQHADTLHVLVSDYRQARKIHLQIEYRLMLQMAQDYVNLTMLQKLEVFKYALDNTTGQDLYHVLWLTSGDSEAWLERRSTYTRSLAVSSMVGHILGLGDRHPANILLDQISGKVIHIDFGDCFEVAMHREKFPERIPFRLTRMLVNAMEVSGIEGSFKKTSEVTMSVLRDNREPLMAVLEAFIYDPLVSWRLTTETDARNRAAAQSANASVAVMKMEPGGYNRYAGGPEGRKQQLNERLALNEDGNFSDFRNAKALEVYQRVQKKLTGRDFDPLEELTVQEQVRKLIHQATALENLCQCFPGWCAFW